MGIGASHTLFVERVPPPSRLEGSSRMVDGMSFVRLEASRSLASDNCLDERRCARAMRRSTFGMGGEGIPSCQAPLGRIRGFLLARNQAQGENAERSLP